MKKSGLMAACMLATLSVAAVAQESSKVSPGGIEVSELLERFAKRNGRQFVVDPRLRAQVILAGIEPGQLTYDQLLAVLSVHQVAVTDSGGILSAVPDANARQIPSPIYTDAGFKASDFEIVNLLVTPKKVCAAQLVPLLRPLMPQAAHLAAEAQTNTLIINDRADNARRIAGMIEALDQRGTGAKDCQAREAAASARPKE